MRASWTSPAEYCVLLPDLLLFQYRGIILFGKVVNVMPFFIFVINAIIVFLGTGLLSFIPSFEKELCCPFGHS